MGKQNGRSKIMNASEIFLIVWACLATAYAVYLYNALKMYMVKSATLAATLAMVAMGDAKIEMKNGKLEISGFEGMVVDGDRVVEIVKKDKA
jgi:hypothetical protein